MTAKVIFRIDKPKTATVAMNHFLRSNPTPNADPSRTPLNRVLHGSPDPGVIQSQCDAIPARQKNTVRAVGFVLTASPEFFENASPEAFEKWVKTADEWLKKEFGSRLLFSHLQMDERTPHVQGLILPTDENGKLAAWRVFGKKRLNELQTSAGKAFSDLGITRGIEGSKAKHTRIKEYYKALHEPMPKVSIPPIPEVPGVLQRGDSALREWGAAIQSATWKAAHEALTHEARAADAGRDAIRQRDSVTFQQTQWKKSAESAIQKGREMTKTIEELRGVSVSETLAELGFEQDGREKEKWKNGGALVTVTPDDFGWYDHIEQKGGGGSIDLVAHVLNKPFGAAVGWMRKTFGDERAARAVAAPAIHKARETVRESRPTGTAPEPVAGGWGRVREYLSKTRRLPGALLDAMHERGDLFADARRNCVFAARDAAGQIVGASLRGSSDGPKPFKGRLGRKDSGCFAVGERGASYVVLVESPIDALSYLALAERDGRGKNLLIVSTDGAGNPPPWLIEQKKTAHFILAHDADGDGDKLAASLGASLSQQGIKHARTRPSDIDPKAKDWNDVLRRKDEGGGGDRKPTGVTLSDFGL